MKNKQYIKYEDYIKMKTDKELIKIWEEKIKTDSIESNIKYNKLTTPEIARLFDLKIIGKKK